MYINTYLLFLLIEVINDDTNKQIQGEERTKYYEDNKVKIHVKIDFIVRLLIYLQSKQNNCQMCCKIPCSIKRLEALI